MNIPPLSGSRPRKASQGMTLVEILVVITIIVVLAALSMVGIARVRSAARGATCTSNLRQIGAAMIAYTGDNSGELPPLEDRTGSGDSLKGIWPPIVADAGYLPRVLDRDRRLGCGSGVWACPDCTDPRGSGTGKVELNFNGYGGAEGTVLKVKRGTQPGSRSLRLSEIPSPERTWLVGDAANTSSPKDVKTGWYAIWADPARWQGSKGPSPRHGGKVNVCMVDGHVESLTVKALQEPKRNYTMK